MLYPCGTHCLSNGALYIQKFQSAGLIQAGTTCGIKIVKDGTVLPFPFFKTISSFDLKCYFHKFYKFETFALLEQLYFTIINYSSSQL